MQTKNNILAIIPARGGSKSIPRKNLKLLGNKPLIAYPIELAKSIEKVTKIVVSTDDKEIANVAKKYGAEVPFLRPKELSGDDVPTLPVLQHAVNFLEEKENFFPDIILVLYPTNPFLKKNHVQKAIDLLETKEINSVISVCEDYGRFWYYNKDEKTYKILYPKERLNRQFYKPLYRENGAIYFSKRNVIMKQGKLVDESNISFIVMNEDEVVDIDTLEDWKKAEEFLKNGNKNS